MRGTKYIIQYMIGNRNTDYMRRGPFSLGPLPCQGISCRATPRQADKLSSSTPRLLYSVQDTARGRENIQKQPRIPRATDASPSLQVQQTSEDEEAEMHNLRKRKTMTKNVQADMSRTRAKQTPIYYISVQIRQSNVPVPSSRHRKE